MLVSSTKNEELKNKVRAEAKRARKEMPGPYRAHKSSLICQALLESLDLTLGITNTAPSDAIIAVYSAFPEEVDLSDFVHALYERDIRVAFPCIVKDAHSTNAVEQKMEMRIVDAISYKENEVPFLLHPLKTYLHESEELRSFTYIPGNKLTMIVCPLVAFDKNNNRLGYGGGNYDRYLTQLSSSCRKIGVAFSEQEVEEVPTDEHDIPLPILSI